MTDAQFARELAVLLGAGWLLLLGAEALAAAWLRRLRDRRGRGG